jgi:hypothetical protein
MRANTIEIQSINISSFNGNEYEITDLIVETNIFEDIFSNTLSASFVVVDGAGVLSNLPIVGQELIQMTFKTPFTSLKVVKLLVYKIENVSSATAHTASYILHTISSEAVENVLSSFSRYYSGTSSEIVQNCFKDYIKSDKKLIIENSRFATELIVPYWTPFYLFNWLAARSVSVQGSQPSFVFYENMKDGFNFKSIESMLTNKSVTRWKYRSSPIDINDEHAVDKQRSIILDYKVVEAYNIVDHCINGMIGTKIFVKDMLKKYVDILSYNYLDDFNNTKHASKYPMIPEKNAAGLRYSNRFVEPKIVFGHSQMFAMKDHDHYDVWVSRRKSFVEQMHSQVLQLTMNGDTEISIGDMVDIDIPDNIPVGIKSLSSSTLSGRYLITSIRHIIKANKHFMSVEVVKESHDTKIGSNRSFIMGV